MNIDSEKLSIVLDGLEDAVNSHPSEKFRQGGHRVLSHIRDEIHSGELTPKRVYARAPDEVKVGYLSPGKEYRVQIDHGVGFDIYDDIDAALHCCWRGCGHLNGANWERVEK